MAVLAPFTGRTMDGGSVLSSAQAGNGDSTNTLDRQAALGPCYLTLAAAVGATPTVTVSFLGSIDNANWFNVPYFVAGTQGPYLTGTFIVTLAGTTTYLLQGAWRFFKTTQTLNTNVTLTTTIYQTLAGTDVVEPANVTTTTTPQPSSAALSETSATTAVGAQIAPSIAAVVGKTGSITGFDIALSTGTAGVVTATVTGLTNTLNFPVATPTAGMNLIQIRFPVPIPASGVNTAIVVTVPATGGAAAVNAANVYGFTN